jgi:hypothetical protein
MEERRGWDLKSEVQRPEGDLDVMGILSTVDQNTVEG